jgi:EpsI family protein
MNKREQLWIGVLVTLLLAGGGLVWSVALQPTLVADTSALEALPDEIGIWRSVRDEPIEEAAEEMLRADLHVYRLYWHPDGGPVWMYIGYYGTARSWGMEHTPDVCYPSGGWAISGERTLTVDASRGLRVNEFTAELDGTTQLIHYYFRSRDRTGLLGVADHVVDKLLSRIRGDPRDGALVRVSTHIEDDGEIAARSRLIAFAAELDPILAERWPVEAPAAL